MPETQPPVRALLFDVGGVLIEIDFQRSFDHWASSAGVAPEALAQRFRVDDAYAAHERGECDASAYFAALRQSLGIDLSDDAFAAGWRALFVGAIGESLALVRAAARQLPVYIFSNTNASHYAYWSMQYPEVLESVTTCYCSHELGLRKPAPESFLRVAGHIGLPPQEIAFFDDLPENIEGAAAAGLQAFTVRTPADIKAALTGSLSLVLPGS